MIEQVEDWPLAVCDAQSVKPEELIAVDSVRRRYVGESYYLPYNAAHRWYYVSGQKRDEVLLITNYDSGDVPGKCERLRRSVMFPFTDGHIRLPSCIFPAQNNSGLRRTKGKHRSQGLGLFLLLNAKRNRPC